MCGARTKLILILDIGQRWITLRLDYYYCIGTQGTRSHNKGILNQLLIHQIPNRKWKEQRSLNLPNPKIQLAHSAVFAHAWQNQSRPDFLCSPVFFQIFLPVLRSSALVVAVLTMSLILLFCPLLTPGDFQYLRPLLKQLLMRARVLSSDCWHHSAISGHKQKTRRPRESAQ